jgi:hypothetical protein
VVYKVAVEGLVLYGQNRLLERGASLERVFAFAADPTLRQLLVLYRAFQILLGSNGLINW